MAFDAAIPPWLVPRESPIDAMVKGVQAGTALARTFQAGQQLALEAQRIEDQHQLAEKQFNLQSETQSLHNEQAMQELEARRADLPLWKDFTAKVNGAKTPDELSAVMESMPQFQSDEYLGRAHNDIVTRSKVIGSTSFAQALAEQNLAESKVIGYNAAWASELSKYPLNSPQRVEQLGKYQAQMREQQATAAINLKRATLIDPNQPPQIVEVSGAKYVRNPRTGALYHVPPDYSQGAQLIPLQDEDGNVKGYGLPNTRGGVTQVREPTTDIKPAERIRALGALQRANIAEMEGLRSDNPRKIQLIDDNKQISDEIKTLTGFKGKSAAPVAPAALPATKAEMVKGKVYQTSKGAATWDGEKFILQ